MQRFWNNQSGATAIEYGMICAVVVLVMLVGLIALGGANGNQYNNVASKVESAM